MPMGQQDLRHLLRLVTQGGKGLHIGADILAGKSGTGLVRLFLRRSGGQTGVHKDHLVPGVDQVVLQAAPVPDAGIKLVRALLAPEDHGLRIKTVFSEFYRFDDHLVVLLFLYSGIAVSCLFASPVFRNSPPSQGPSQELPGKRRRFLQLPVIGLPFHVKGLPGNGDPSLRKSLSDQVKGVPGKPRR